MSRRTITMAAVLGLILAGAFAAGGSWSSTARAGDFASGDGAAREATEGDSKLIPPRSSDAAAQKTSRPIRGAARPKPSGGGWGTTLGGLVAVLGLIFLTAKVLKKSVPAAQKSLPPEVVQVLGRRALDYRHTVHLVRLGSRMLVIGTSQEGMTTLCEITDRVEIDYLAGLCKPGEPAAAGQNFQHLFKRFQNPEPPHTEGPAEIENELDAQSAPEPEVERDEDSDSDPAILRLQERLEKSARSDFALRPDLKNGNGPQSAEIPG